MGTNTETTVDNRHDRIRLLERIGTVRALKHTAKSTDEDLRCQQIEDNLIKEASPISREEWATIAHVRVCKEREYTQEEN